MECLEYMRELLLGQAAEESNDGVEFGDHVLLLVVLESSIFDPDGPRPGSESLVGCSQSSGEFDRSLPGLVGAWRTRDRKLTKKEISDVGFHEALAVPIQWDRTQHAKQIRPILFIAARPKHCGAL
jgi:hypothetical protein